MGYPEMVIEEHNTILELEEEVIKQREKLLALERVVRLLVEETDYADDTTWIRELRKMTWTEEDTEAQIEWEGHDNS